MRFLLIVRIYQKNELLKKNIRITESQPQHSILFCGPVILNHFGNYSYAFPYTVLPNKGSFIL